QTTRHLMIVLQTDTWGLATSFEVRIAICGRRLRLRAAAISVSLVIWIKGTPMPSQIVLVDVADRVATITLNRPEARNALSVALIAELASAVAAADANDGVDVIILTGADPVFSAGVDLKEVGSPQPSTPADTPRPPRRRGPF